MHERKRKKKRNRLTGATADGSKRTFNELAGTM